MKKIHIEALRKNFGETFSRFWMTLVYCAALALFCTLMIRDLGFGKERLNAAMAIYLMTGIFVSVSLDLRRQIYNRKWLIIAGAVSHIIIILNAIYVAHIAQADFSAAQFFDVAAVVALCVVSPFVRPFLRKKDDMGMWQFWRKFIMNGALNGIVVVALQVGIQLLIASAESLFGIKFQKFYLDVAIWLWVLLFPTMILMRTPLLAEIQTERVTDKFSFVILRLFSILLCVYLLMLYVYILRIAATWELPKGMVSMPVSCMMILLIAVRCIAYGINTEGKKIDSRFLKLLPWLALPTLVLMSVGIGRRLMDYGMTAPRFYLVLLNLWFYAMCVYMILRQRLMPIIVSFIAIAFFSSFGPTSACRLFPEEDAEKEKTEETKKFVHSKWFGNSYLSDGMEISLPQPVSQILCFNTNCLSKELKPNAAGKYLVTVIDDYPFLIPRDLLLDTEAAPLVLQCTNGKTIVLMSWQLDYDDEDVSKVIKLNSLAGYMVK